MVFSVMSLLSSNYWKALYHVTKFLCVTRWLIIPFTLETLLIFLFVADQTQQPPHRVQDKQQLDLDSPEADLDSQEVEQGICAVHVLF